MQRVGANARKIPISRGHIGKIRKGWCNLDGQRSRQFQSWNRKKEKALVDKPMDGNPGKQKLTVVDFFRHRQAEGQDMPSPKE